MLNIGVTYIIHSDDELLSFQIATCGMEEIEIQQDDCMQGERRVLHAGYQYSHFPPR